MTSAWVVIPTYNEVDNVSDLIVRVGAALERCDPAVHGRILIVDDGSPDGTGALADAIAATRSDVAVLHRPAKGGIAGAYVAGFQRALTDGADLVVQMDADFSHDPRDIPRLIAAARGGADLVLGSRYVVGGATDGWTWHRRWLSRLGGRYASAVLGLAVTDPTGGFKCLTARTLRTIDLDELESHGYVFQVELTHAAVAAALSISEVPIVFRERQRGHSKMSAAIAIEALWRVPLIRLHAVQSRLAPASGH
jgi:dolichol-phosphate mannosyltransferase